MLVPISERVSKLILQVSVKYQTFSLFVNTFYSYCSDDRFITCTNTLLTHYLLAVTVNL